MPPPTPPLAVRWGIFLIMADSLALPAARLPSDGHRGAGGGTEKDGEGRRGACSSLWIERFAGAPLSRGGLRSPHGPPGVTELAGTGEGIPLPQDPIPPPAPASCVQATPAAGYDPFTSPAGLVQGSFRFGVHAAKADCSRRVCPLLHLPLL